MLTNKLAVKEQTTIETCLSMCLMALLDQKGINVPACEEIKILIEGLKFTKFDYTTGHLVYVSSKYDVAIEQYIEFPIFYKFLSKYKYPSKLKLICKKINKKLMIKLLKTSPIIIYVDSYYISGSVHISHLVILEKLDDNLAIILDPWDGKRKKIETKLLVRSIQSLRNKLKISPKIIRFL
ncbi:hypothetical protein HY025_04095 [Candidatus Daviesbacteria bacterium]|nr:hypothetical protein [Candidatus Daviesbacteria bacterium]